jgi:hypothetical protein
MHTRKAAHLRPLRAAGSTHHEIDKVIMLEQNTVKRVRSATCWVCNARNAHINTITGPSTHTGICQHLLTHLLYSAAGDQHLLYSATSVDQLVISNCYGKTGRQQLQEKLRAFCKTQSSMLDKGYV